MNSPNLAITNSPLPALVPGPWSQHYTQETLLALLVVSIAQSYLIELRIPPREAMFMARSDPPFSSSLCARLTDFRRTCTLHHVHGSVATGAVKE